MINTFKNFYFLYKSIYNKKNILKYLLIANIIIHVIVRLLTQVANL